MISYFLPEFDGIRARCVSRSGPWLTLEYKHPHRGLQICKRHISQVDFVPTSPGAMMRAANLLKAYRENPASLGYKHGAKIAARDIIKDAGRKPPRRFDQMVVILEEMCNGC